MTSIHYINNHEPTDLADAKKLIEELRYALKHGTKHLVRAKSGYRGVDFQKHSRLKPWRASYRHHMVQYVIGHYATKEEAAMAYNAAVSVHSRTTYPLNDLSGIEKKTVKCYKQKENTCFSCGNAYIGFSCSRCFPHS